MTSRRHTHRASDLVRSRPHRGGDADGPRPRDPVTWARRLAPIGLVLAAVAAFAAVRPGPFRSTVTSPQALLRIGGGVVVLRVVSLGLRRLGQGERTRRLIVGVGTLVIVGLVVAPYFRNETVVEALPSTGAELGGSLAPGPARPPPSTAPASTVPPAAPAPTVPRAAPAVATSGVPPAPPATAPRPQKLSEGTLQGIGHRASGRAAVYRLADGTRLVRLEDIDVENGPDYLVYLVPGADARSPDGGVSLGALKGNRGSQNYPIAAGTGVEAPRTVLIWCRAFAVPVAHATLQAT